MQTTVLNLAGISTPVLQGGDTGNAEAIVFMHGNPGSGNDWSDLMHSAAPFVRVIAPDMPGFGKADKPDHFNYTVEGYAQHLASLLDALCIKRVHLVLHDFGCPWGFAWAGEHLDQIASITLVNNGILPAYRWHYVARLWRMPLIGELIMATTTLWSMRLLLSHGNPRGLPKKSFDEMYDNFDSKTRKGMLRLYRNTSDIGA
jgi:pimeloyl-ACP methyl ester carboxylesterase